MRSFLSLAALAALLIPTVAHAQLCGTYTVDGSQPTAGTNYNSFSDAAAVLNTIGVSCDVTFDVAPGTYDESVELGEIPGASDAARTRFRAADVNDRPVLQNAGASILTNWVIRLDGTDYVRFVNLDLEATLSVDGRLIVFENEATNNEVRGCTLSGVVGSANDRGTLVWSDDTAHNGNVFEDNTFTQGYVGLDFSDTTTPFSDSLVVRGNVFASQTEGGIEIEGADAIVDDNGVTSWAGSNDSYRGIDVWSYGFDLHSVQITNNVVDLSIGDIGIRLGSTSFRQRLLANNVVSLRSATGTAAIYFHYGEVDVYHNTAMTAQGASSASALYVEDNLTMEGVVLANNILIDDAGGFALRAPGGQIESSDYNVLDSDGGFVAGFDGVPYPTLADFQVATGLDMNSIEEAVTFVQPPPGSPDLHLAGASLDDLDLIGTPVGVLTDVDGDDRDAFNPKRGADEGTPLPPLDNADEGDGFYAVAGASPDFATPEEAFTQLKRRGMKGAVTFRIRAGTFELRASLPSSLRVGPALGNPAATPLIVRAANPNDRPVLQYAATESETNWLFRFNALDYVTLENLNLESTSTDGFGRLIVLVNGVEHLTVDNCTLTGLEGVSSDEATLVFGEDAGDRFNTFSNNTFTNGYQGLKVGLLDGSDFAEGNAATDNTFDNQKAGGLKLTRQADNVIEANVVKTGPNSAGSYVGITAGGPGLVLERNRVTASGGARGITIGEGGDENSRRRVVNNAVLLTGDAADAGIDLNANGFVDVYHNTVLIDDTFGLTTPTGFATDPGGAGLDLRNNVFVNRGLGTAYAIADAGAVTRSDYNNLRSSGATYAVWDGVSYATRNALRSATAPDELHTKAVPVTFVDAAAGNLGLAGASVGDDRLAGEPLADVTVDYEGDARSTTAPYRGADEAADPLSASNYVLEAINTTPLSVAAGGAVSFSYAITNNTASAANGDFYYTATGGSQGVVRSGSLPAGETLTATFNQQIPGTTPPGTYSYTLKIGTFPNQAVDEVAFSITVTAAPRVVSRERGGTPEAWTVTDATPWVPIDEGALGAARVAPADDTADAAPTASVRPETFALHAAAPNPFAGRTALRFDLPEAADVRVVVYDLLGRAVAVLADGSMAAGRHTVPFDARGLPSGTYLVRMETDAFVATRRVTLAR